jgi:uncharacterized protein (TIGR00369 family)
MPADNAQLLAMMRSRKAATASLLGLELIDIDGTAGTTRYSMIAKPEFCNPMGNLQGGIIATALDDASATAIIARAGRRVGVPTLEFKVSFFAAARMNQQVFAIGRVIKFGRTIVFAEADLEDATGKLLARLSTSVMLVEVEGPGHFL